MLLAAAAGVAVCGNLYGFLAPNAPPREGLLVIEGWLPDYALDEAVRMFQEGPYEKVACTGHPLETGHYLVEWQTYPEMTAARLEVRGVDPAKMLIVPAPVTRRDRTYAAARALGDALGKSPSPPAALHLVSLGPHGRRSRLLYRKALGSKFEIGVTCLPSAEYDPERWWAASAGVRAVTGELIAYLYARLFFHPGS